MYEVRTVAVVLPLNLRRGNENHEREREITGERNKKENRRYTNIVSGEVSAGKWPGKFSIVNSNIARLFFIVTINHYVC